MAAPMHFDPVYWAIQIFWWLVRNWPLAMSALGACVAAVVAFKKKYGRFHVVLVGVGTLTVLVWLILGVNWLINPVVVAPSPNFDYALGFTGPTLSYNPDEKTLQVGANFANVGPAAIRYEVTDFRVIVGHTTLPEPQNFLNHGGILPKALTRTFFFPSFSKELTQEYIGTSVSGSMSFTVVYGPSDGNVQRKLTMSIQAFYNLDPSSLGVTNIIEKEDDVPYAGPPAYTGQ